MRLLEISLLYESRLDNIIQSRGSKLEDHASQFEGKRLSAQQILDVLVTADPNPQSKNIQWLVNQYMARQFRLEDASRVRKEVLQFTSIRAKLPKKDINQYSYHEVSELVDEHFNNVELSDDTGHVDGTKVLYDGPLGLLIQPLTKQAAQTLGKGTKWCTSAEQNNMFNAYSSKGPLYIWKDKSGAKIQIWIPTVKDNIDEYYDEDDEDEIDSSRVQVTDARDREIDDLDQLRHHPVIGKLFHEHETRLLQADNPHGLIDYAAYVVKGRWSAAEPVIIQDPDVACDYAIHVIKGAWPEAEPVISSGKYSKQRYEKYIQRSQNN